MSLNRAYASAATAYLSAQVIGLAVSLASFPIMARLFTVGDYGIICLCNTTILAVCAVAKLGLQNAAVRYYSDSRRDGRLDQFYATFAWGAGGAALLATALMMGVAPAVTVGGKNVWIAASMVLLGQTVFSISMSFLRSEERAWAFSLSQMVCRVAGTFGGIALVVWGGAGMAGIFWGQVPLLLLPAAWVFLGITRRYPVSPRFFSGELFREGLIYGLPLVLSELSSIVLAFSDRYLIQWFAGTERLGIYVAGYTLGMYIADLVRQPLQQAVMPVYLRLFAEQGEKATADFIRDATGYAALAALPVFAGFLAVREDLVVLAASAKYREAAAIAPWVLGSVLLYGCQPLFAAGFYLRRRTVLFSGIILAGGAANIAVNLWLIPRFGIAGAAWSTAGSYVAVTLAMAAASQRMFPLRWPVKRIALASLGAAGMYLLLSAMPESLGARIVSGTLFYVLAMLLLDRDLLRRLRFAIEMRLRPAEAP